MKHPVLIAEDDDDLLSVLSLMLEDDFDLTLASDGQTAIDEISKQHFHFIIVDIHLPVKSGLDICRHVAALNPNNRPSVVILSGDLAEKTVEEAYSLGASDYIGKPFNVVAFHQRVMRLSRDITQINALQQDDAKKRTLAETAMKQAAAYGSGLELLAQLNQCQTVERFMEVLTNGLLAQGYHCAVEFRVADARYHFDVDTRVCSDNEIKVFELLHDKGRIYHFGKRTIFNEPTASILVKNMPTEGTLSYDAAIDLFAKLVPAVGSRFVSLLNVITMQTTRASLHDTIDMVKQAIANMEIDRKQKMQDIAATIGVSFHELDMTEVQESFFLNLIEKKLNEDASNETFLSVVNLLDECAKNLEIDDSAVQEEPEDHDDIELF
ncbi:response regulator [Aestuariibacter salexigens]|uniref:response regulator n=1 Tax=Aestuariibacter salexigens TaxID=226010 RepID=UPI0004000082|nr:response regulator [Aestuariibacter salexigens]